MSKAANDCDSAPEEAPTGPVNLVTVTECQCFTITTVTIPPPPPAPEPEPAASPLEPPAAVNEQDMSSCAETARQLISKCEAGCGSPEPEEPTNDPPSDSCTCGCAESAPEVEVEEACPTYEEACRLQPPSCLATSSPVQVEQPNTTPEACRLPPPSCMACSSSVQVQESKPNSSLPPPPPAPVDNNNNKSKAPCTNSCDVTPLFYDGDANPTSPSNDKCSCK